jgi:hypothetical protein
MLMQAVSTRSVDPALPVIRYLSLAACSVQRHHGTHIDQPVYCERSQAGSPARLPVRARTTLLPQPHRSRPRQVDHRMIRSGPITGHHRQAQTP